VGKNATGKSRTLNLIWNLAGQFCRKQKTGNCGYNAVFSNGDTASLQYDFFVNEGVVASERVVVDGDERLLHEDGKLKIWAKYDKHWFNFRPPADELSAVVRRDDLQHPFLNPLHEWASGVRLYHLGSAIGKQLLALKVDKAPPFQEMNESHVVPIFSKGLDRFRQPFVDAIRNDMARVGYRLSAIMLEKPGIELVADSQVMIDPERLASLAVTEDGVHGSINQLDMSQGMYRVLALLVHVNYAQMSGGLNSVLIDDIGEGLDFERSSALVGLMRDKAIESQFQLVMSTNDEFVMNSVPIEEWSVLVREGCNVSVKNAHNSRPVFERFKDIGLSNFSFFEMDFIHGEPAPDGGVTAHG
jgi:hypothetical protein